MNIPDRYDTSGSFALCNKLGILCTEQDSVISTGRI